MHCRTITIHIMDTIVNKDTAWHPTNIRDTRRDLAMALFSVGYTLYRPTEQYART